MRFLGPIRLPIQASRARWPRYLDENTGPDNPRVYRNAVILVTPSRDGLQIAQARVRDYLAWGQVKTNLKEQETEGAVDVARLQTLAINIDKAELQVKESFLPKFKEVLSSKMVARFYQIENKLDTIIDFGIATEIPLVRGK